MSVMICVCLPAQEVGSIHIVDGNMNAEKYQQVIADHFTPSIPNLSTESEKSHRRNSCPALHICFE